MQHKHSKLIHEWADGAPIQYLQKTTNTWIDVDEPVWDKNTEYRIKPHQLESWQLELLEAVKLGEVVEVEIAKDTWVVASVLERLVRMDELEHYEWSPQDCYRVRPQPLYLWAFLNDGEWYLHTKLITEQQAKRELAGFARIKKVNVL